MIHLFVDASAASSGSGPTYVRNIVPHLAARTDLRCTILLSPWLRREIRDYSNVSFVEFKDESRNAATRFLHVQRLVPELIRRTEADVLLSAGNFAVFHCPVPQILLSGNALYTSAEFFHDVMMRGCYGLWLDTKVKSHIAKWSISVADCTIAPSQAFAEEIKRWTGIRAHAIHHGFDPSLFFEDVAPVPQELQAKLSRVENELRLLFVSHYNYYRNFETLFRALPLLAKLIPNHKVKLFLTCRLEAGTNPGSYQPERAATLVRQLGIAASVVELEAVPYQLLHHVYRACDIYVSPAYVETFAHPLVEAMASGLPVIASDLTVHREVCGDAALYFPAFSPDVLAEAVSFVTLSRERYHEMSAKGLERSKDFSWKNHVGEIISVAEGLVHGRASPRPTSHLR